MLLIVEILLTVAVWRKGWKGWALLPVGIECVLAFFIGMAVGAAGVKQEGFMGVALLLDVMTIVALVIMRVRAPKRVQEDRRAELSTGGLQQPVVERT